MSLVRRLELIPALDRAIETAPKVGGLRPVKQRARGCSPGQLLVAVAESQLCGGDSMLDLERLRADEAGAELRAVAEVPAASTACQLARRYRRSHLRAAEAAFAACANAWTISWAARPDGEVTLDFDSTGVEVYGRNKPGAGVNYQGQLAYQPLLCSWAQRGRLLATELSGGQRLHARRRAAPDCCGARWATCPTATARSPPASIRRLLPRRPARRLPHARGALLDLRAALKCDVVGAGAHRRRRLAPAEGLKDAEVAETTYTPTGWEHEPLRLIVRRVAHQADALSR